MKKNVMLILLAITTFMFTGCDDAQVVSSNLTKSADNFELDRRIIFYNGITGEYMLNIEGKCSIFNNGQRVEVVCKTGQNIYKKHFLGLSDNVTYFAEQLESKNVSAYHYRVTFKPQAILPDVDFKGSITDLPQNQN